MIRGVAEIMNAYRVESVARAYVQSEAPGVPVTQIPHHAGVSPPALAGVTRAEARARLGLPADAFLVGQFGFITKPKQPAAVLDGFARLLARRPDALLLVVGENQVGVGVEQMLARRGLQFVYEFNPLWYVLEIVRYPLMHAAAPATEIWSFTLLYLLLVATLAVVIENACKKRLVYHL